MSHKKNGVVFVHNWLTNRGGSENVLFELHKLYPDAPIYTLVYKKELFPELKDADVRTTWLQRIPLLRYHHELFPPLRYFIWRYKKLKNYQVVFSNSSSENKAVRSPGATHISYIHTPPHYYWRYHEEYITNPGFGKLDPFARVFLKTLNPLLKHLDRKAAQNPDIILANSQFIASEIKRYYGRTATVVYPPVDTKRFAVKNLKLPEYTDYYLTFGRQTVFKKFDIVIDAFKELKKNLVIVGTGPEHDILVKQAEGSDFITFLGFIPSEQLASLVQHAKACVFANEEDFGITWVESMAAGTPVITFASGGALETVVAKKTGVFFEKQTASSLMEAVSTFEKIAFKKTDIKQQAMRFDTESFKATIKNIIDPYL